MVVLGVVTDVDVAAGVDADEVEDNTDMGVLIVEVDSTFVTSLKSSNSKFGT